MLNGVLPAPMLAGEGLREEGEQSCWGPNSRGPRNDSGSTAV